MNKEDGEKGKKEEPHRPQYMQYVNRQQFPCFTIETRAILQPQFNYSINIIAYVMLPQARGRKFRSAQCAGMQIDPGHEAHQQEIK